MDDATKERFGMSIIACGALYLERGQGSLVRSILRILKQLGSQSEVLLKLISVLVAEDLVRGLGRAPCQRPW